MPAPLAPALLALLCLLTNGAHAGWLDDLKRKLGEFQSAPAAGAAPGGALAATLSDEEVARALKEALARGTQQAVASLGRDGGYLNNLDVRIPLPESLRKVEKLLRGIGQGQYADQFVASLNQAAEKAAPEAAAIFADAITRMSLADAQTLLKGPEDAATQYFRKTSEARLRERFQPIVQAATDQAGVTAAYKKLIQKAGPAARLLGEDAGDLDGYVESRAIDGLFKMIAAEEKRIRQDPLARGTELLKKVFGSLAK